MLVTYNLDQQIEGTSDLQLGRSSMTYEILFQAISLYNQGYSFDMDQ